MSRQSLVMGETGPHGLDDLLTGLPRCCRGGVDDDVGELPAPGLTLMEHLDELVVDGPQGHRPGRIKAITGGQHASGTGQGHGRWEELKAAMMSDKKVRGGRLRLVLLDDVARPVRMQAPGEDLLIKAHDAVTGHADPVGGQGA